MKSETLLNICGVPTTVVTLGKGIEEVKKIKEPQEIVLMIPGNPGYIPRYEEFLEEIYNALGIPVWIVSHAGHELETSVRKFPPLKGNESLYDTNGQVMHKVEFIEQYVPDNAKLYLIGHSIGPYIILQLLKKPEIQAKVIGSYLLFPTIEKMAESPKGKAYIAGIKYHWILLLFLHILGLFPQLFLLFLMNCYCLLSGTSKRIGKIYVDLFNPDMLKKALLLGNNEMIIVKERDTETLKANKDKIKLYYGFQDGWTPPSYYTQLQRDIPGIDVEIGDRNYKHNFLSTHSKEVGKLVADWIKNKKM